MRTHRRTKIVATLGPASDEPPVLEALVAAGMDVARLNFSHGDHAGHRGVVRRARAAARARGREIAILADLSGPKLRVGELEDDAPIVLEDGASVLVTARRVAGTAERISIAHRHLARDLAPGHAILLADGTISLRVAGREGEDLRCEVVEGGRLRPRAGAHFPDAVLSGPNPTGKDWNDLEAALAMGVDWVAQSFVQRADDVVLLKRRLARWGATVPVIAKIETPQALADLGAILDAADGVMVARGDLGVACPTEDVPFHQKHVIAEANRRALPVITATQMLESMVSALRPTRAEASDVANAILDGTDAIMLSAETATGDHPVQAVRTMAAIALRAERSDEYRRRMRSADDAESARGDVTEAVAQAARRAAEHAGAAAILVHAITGESARRVARQRPHVPIHVLSNDLSTIRQLQLVHGIRALRVRAARSTDAMVAAGLAAVRDAGLVEQGSLVAVVAGSNPLVGASNMMKLSRIP